MKVDSTTITNTSQKNDSLISSATTVVAGEDAKSFKTEFQAVKSQNMVSQTSETVNENKFEDSQNIVNVIDVNNSQIVKNIIAEENIDRVKEPTEMTNIADLNGAKTALKQSSDQTTNNINTNLETGKGPKITGEVSSQQGQPSFAQVQQEAQKNLEPKTPDNKQNSKDNDLLLTAQVKYNNVDSKTSVNQVKQDDKSEQTLPVKYNNVDSKTSVNQIKPEDKSEQILPVKKNTVQQANPEVVFAQIQQDNNVNPQSNQVKASGENVKNNLTGQVQKDQHLKPKGTVSTNTKGKDISDSLDELSSKIATINELKTSASVKTNPVAKSKTTKVDGESGSQIKMDNSDIMFFVNLAQNQGVHAEASAAVNVSNMTAQNATVEATTETASQSMQVSQTLLNALTDSMQTNKPFRIDFDSDVAVIMKVDKNGNLSANFIPGSAAVENYLRNNIELLRQNFDNQNLPYNELTYGKQQKQGQQQRNNKENDDE